MTAVAALVVSGLSGCGGSSRADDAAKTGGDEQASASSTTTVEGAAEAGSSKSGGGKAGAKAGGATTTTAPGKDGSAKGGDGSKASQSTPTTEDPFRMTLPLTAEVSEKCVRPGGLQTVTLRAPYGSGVGYQIVYADGLQAMMEGHYGGNGAGYTDEEGTYVDTFSVAATAPPGPAGVNALGTHMDHGFGEAHAHFAVADPLGKCRPEDMD